jgi:hypothetical protein
MIWLASTGAIAGILIGAAIGVERVAAVCARVGKPIILADAVKALVLIYTRGALNAAVRSVLCVIWLANSGPITGVALGTLVSYTTAAFSTDRLILFPTFEAAFATVAESLIFAFRGRVARFPVVNIGHKIACPAPALTVFLAAIVIVIIFRGIARLLVVAILSAFSSTLAFGGTLLNTEFFTVATFTFIVRLYLSCDNPKR